MTPQKNEAFAELIQFLDDESLSLVMRDAMDNNRAVLNILRSQYTLYTELTSRRRVL